MTAPIGDADLQAYLDDQLDTGGRIEVERWLQDHPEAAAEVMAALAAARRAAPVPGRGRLAAPHRRRSAWRASCSAGSARRRSGRASGAVSRRRCWSAPAGGRTRSWACSSTRSRQHTRCRRSPRRRPRPGALCSRGSRPAIAPEAGTMSLPARLTGERVPAADARWRIDACSAPSSCPGTAAPPWWCSIVRYDRPAGQPVRGRGRQLRRRGPEVARPHGLPTVFWQVGPSPTRSTAACRSPISWPSRARRRRSRGADFELHRPTEGATHG